MNRLIIIGNGFDIAHGIRSSFKDFIEDYFRNALNTFIENNIYSDELFELRHEIKGRKFQESKILEIDEVFIFLEDYINREDIIVNFKSSFLESIYKSIDNLNWVDIEVIYFKQLSTQAHHENRKKIKKINSELTFLKGKLIEYLRIQEENFKNGFAKDPLTQCFCEKIKKNEIVTISLDIDESPEIYIS